MCCMATPTQGQTRITLVLFDGTCRRFQSVPIADSDPVETNAITSERMKATAKTLRRRARKKPACPSVISIQTNQGPGNRRWVTADLVDVIDGGCGLVSMTLLRSGSTVVVRGKLAEGHTADQLRAAVRWCIGKPDGTFRAGLQFLDGHSAFRPDPDYYEVLQLSPNADAETISRVYRILAARFHPDNTETGNSEKFIQLCEAHQILSDSDKRASYDVRHQAASSPAAEAKAPSPVGALRGWNAALGHPSL